MVIFSHIVLLLAILLSQRGEADNFFKNPQTVLK